MGLIRAYIPAQLVVGVLSSWPEKQQELILRVQDLFGLVLEVTKPVPFLFTDYYNKEMGTPIERFFIVFKNLVDPSTLAQIKMDTNTLEEHFLEDGRRRINLDPGILSGDNFILATTKDRSHRIPLCHGIFGEVTLIYTKGAFQILPWTYADYKSDEYRALFKEFRTRYLSQLKNQPFI